MTNRPLMNRRSFLTGSAALAFLAACRASGLKGAPAGNAGTPTKQLKILNWAL